VNKNKKAFTLIELLIVVAIIAILAAIAVPNFLEAQVRSKVSRAQADMRSLATAVEAYSVDCKGQYPVSLANNDVNWESNGSVLGSKLNCNNAALAASGTVSTGAQWRMCFSIAPGLRTLTTPTAYITSYPVDPFARTKNLVFGYINVGDTGWMLWSFGPDDDEFTGGQLGEGVNPGWSNVTPKGPMNYYHDRSYTNSGVPAMVGYGWNHSYWNTHLSDRVYHPNMSNPSPVLLTAGYTYDTTNGTRSWGDIYRVKQ